MNIKNSALPLILSTLLIACAGYAPMAAAPTRVADGVLTDARGMTLYVFDKDTAGSGKSVCNGPCATNWPPLMVTEGEDGGTAYSIVTRDDGSKQWAFKGKPLYRWAKDQKPGDRTGDGFNTVWHVATP